MMGIPTFSPFLTLKELSTFKTSNSAGRDQVHAKLLQWMTTFLTETLADLFCNCLATIVVPGDWKAAVICPTLSTTVQ